MSASAEEVRVFLRLWPLLRGSVEISSVSLRKPALRIVATEGEESGKQAFDAVATYRNAVQPVVDALREFAPDTELRIEGASINTDDLRELNLGAHTSPDAVDVQLSATSGMWKRLSVKGRIEYADLAARAEVELDDLVVDKEVPPARLRAQLRTDAKSTIECDFDARVGTVAAAKGKVQLPAGKPPHIAAQVTSIDMAQALGLARRKVGGLDVIESAEGLLSAHATFTLAEPWHAQVAITRSSAALKLAPLPWRISADAAHVTLTERQVRVTGARGAVGDSPFENVAAQVELGKNARLSAASGNATLRLEQWFPWLKDKVALDEIDSLTGSADVALKRLALRFDRPADAVYEASVTPRKVGAVLKALPAPLQAAEGAVLVDRETVRLQGVAVAMLDARTRVSGTFLVKKQSLELALAEGVAGEKIVQWALERGAVPSRFEPKTPLRFAAQRIAWAPKGPLVADARIDFERGPALGLALAWRPELLELRRVTIKDASSDAVLGATVGGELIQASFSGRLHGQSIPGMLRQPLAADSGLAQGELKVTIDRKQPERTLAEGKLRIEGLDLSWLAGKKALIERAELVAERDGARIIDARLGWEDQFFELRGEGKRTDRGPVVDARIESAGVDVFRLLPPPDPNAPRKKSSAFWPLPVSGRVEVAAGFVQYKDYRIEPFDGVLSLEPRRARLEVKAARMCGVSFPMEVQLEPEINSAAVHVSMKDEPLEKAVRCLTGGNVEITGNADLKAELRTQGQRPHLLRDMTGTAQAELRKGRVKKFALLGNILSFRNIASLGEMKEDGFPYRSITARGRFEKGQFLVEESFFDSDAVRLAANGRVDMLGANSQLTVLVGLLTTVDRVAGAIPIIGDIFGGSMTALPMAVHGDIRNPVIVPLGPRAVTDQLLGIFERTLKLPGKLVVPAQEAK